MYKRKHDSQEHSALFINQCLAQSLSEKLPPAGDGNTETHSGTKYRDGEPLEHSVLNGLSPSNPLRAQRPLEGKGERLQESEEMDDTKEIKAF